MEVPNATHLKGIMILDNIFDFSADILNSSYTEKKTLLLQTGDVTSSTVRSNDVEVWQPSGYLGRPAKPTGTEDSAQAISLIRGDHDVAIGFRDLRANSLQETLDFGEVQIFAGGPNNSGISKIVLNNDGTNQKVTVTCGNTLIEVLSDGSVNIVADAINLGNRTLSSFVALANKVNSELNSIATTLGTGSNSGGPVIFATPYLPSPVDASKTKAE